MELAKEWFTVCSFFVNNYEELKVMINVDLMELDYLKAIESSRSELLPLQQKIYFDLIAQNKQAEAKQFIESEDLMEKELEDHRPVVTIIKNKKINEMSNEFLEIQTLN